MGVLDILKTGKDLIFGKNGTRGPEAPNPAMESVAKNAETERGNLLWEAGRSMLLRQFPRAAATFDIGKAGYDVISGKGIAKSLANFNTITSLLILCPDISFKRMVTDFIANLGIFRWLVEKWPGLDGMDIAGLGSSGFLAGIEAQNIMGKGGSLRKLILEDKDPNAVIMAMRIMYQDFNTGKVGMESLGLGSMGSAAGSLGIMGAVGGALALTDGALGNPLGNGSGPAVPEGKAVEAVSDAMKNKGTLKDKKIQDLIKKNPALEQTTMQLNLTSLLKSMNLLDSAVLYSGDWNDNNDYCTVAFVYNNGVYYMTFDNDTTGTDISVRNSAGATVYNETDWNGIDADDDAKEILEAISKNPSPDISTSNAPTPAPAAAAATPDQPTPSSAAPVPAATPGQSTPSSAAPVPANTPSNKPEVPDHAVREMRIERPDVSPMK